MDFAFAFALVAVTCSLLVAAASIWSDARSTASCLFALAMGACGVEAFLLGLAQSSVNPIQASLYYSWAMASRAAVPGFWLLFSLVYGRGNASEFLQKWRDLWIGALALPIILALGWRREFIVVLVDPTTGQSVLRLTTMGLLFQGLTLLILLLSLVNLEHTFRAAVGTVRWRIKYMIIGLGLLLGVRAYAASQTILYRAIDPFLATVNNGSLALSCFLVFRSLLRAGQWDVSTYPERSAFLNSVTVLAAGAYLLIVGVLAKVAAWLGGDASFQLKAFAILISVVGVTVLTLSDRVRLRVRRWTSYYLQKPLYDYRAVWRSFTEGLATHIDETALCQSVTKLTAQTFELLSVSIWLVDEKKQMLDCVASTTLSPTAIQELQPTRKDVKEIIRNFQAHHEPINLERNKALWAEALRQAHPVQFRSGGDRLCAPLTAGGELLGLMLLGDRVGGVSFSLQDYDLLRCVADQIAAGLHNSRLSRRLLQNKEMEAFQAMSTFFVHDLKNLASTLNLMLKNLPIHFDNPEFRADALRGIGKTCDHINHLVSRLSLLRQSMQLRLEESDLNKTVASALATCAAPAGVEIRQQLNPVPKIMLDSSQMEKVIMNLALNAAEAVSGPGVISVETNPIDGWVALTVADTGCGMETEFITRSLFRPFQTTKKKGLGIGMFQSKMIVEAHGGRIEVESEKGKGSTFRVLLPLPRPVA